MNGIEDLPDTILIYIFQHLRSKNFPVIRAVCRRWSQIVSDTVCLRRKYSLWIHPNNPVINEILLDQHADLKYLFTFVNSPYNTTSKITFRNVLCRTSVRDEQYSKLWEKFAVTLEHLCINLFMDLPDPNSSSIFWLFILRRANKLIELSIKFHNIVPSSLKFLDDIYNVDFQLGKLKKVKLDSGDPSLNEYLIKILTRYAHALHEVELKGETQIEFNTLYTLIESKSATLKTLIFHNDMQKCYLLQYLSINELSLDSLKIDALDMDVWQRLLNHKNLKKLDCRIRVQKGGLGVLQQLGRSLTKLEELEVVVSYFAGFDVPFPGKSTSLKLLSLHVYHEKLPRGRVVEDVTFSVALKNPNLQTLKIINNEAKFIIAKGVIENFVDKFPNLKVLEIDYRVYPSSVSLVIEKLVQLEALSVNVSERTSPKDVFKDISKLKNLRKLKILNYIQYCDNSFFVDHLRVPTLKALNLRTRVGKNLRITDRGIAALCKNCPFLEELDISSFDGITDAALDEIGAKLIHLDYLYRFDIMGKNLSRQKLHDIAEIIQNRRRL